MLNKLNSEQRLTTSFYGISRFSGRGRWILCIVTDVAEIVGVAMQRNGCGLKISRVSSVICPASISYKVGNYGSLVHE